MWSSVVTLVQCGPVLSSVVHCGSVWSSVVQCGPVWSSVVQCGLVWFSVVQCGPSAASSEIFSVHQCSAVTLTSCGRIQWGMSVLPLRGGGGLQDDETKLLQDD